LKARSHISSTLTYNKAIKYSDNNGSIVVKKTSYRSIYVCITK